MRKAPVHLEDVADSLVIRNVNFSFYDMFIDGIGERPSRVSFDGHTLEMAMTLSYEHEGLKCFLRTAVYEIARASKTQLVQGGSSTLKDRRNKKGLESDECFWIRNASAVRGVKRLNLNIHPPPDLVFEIDVTHAAVDRESIYLTMGVPEMWHYADATGLTAWVNRRGEWQRVQRSQAFAALRIADLQKYVARYVAGEDEMKLLADWATFLRDDAAKRKSK